MFGFIFVLATTLAGYAAHRAAIKEVLNTTKVVTTTEDGIATVAVVTEVPADETPKSRLRRRIAAIVYTTISLLCLYLVPGVSTFLVIAAVVSRAFRKNVLMANHVYAASMRILLSPYFGIRTFFATPGTRNQTILKSYRIIPDAHYVFA